MSELSHKSLVYTFGAFGTICNNGKIISMQQLLQTNTHAFIVLVSYDVRKYQCVLKECVKEIYRDQLVIKINGIYKQIMLCGIYEKYGMLYIINIDLWSINYQRGVEMKKVYLVKQTQPAEDLYDHTFAVFTNERAAKKLCAAYNNLYKNGDEHFYSVEEMILNKGGI